MMHAIHNNVQFCRLKSLSTCATIHLMLLVNFSSRIIFNGLLCQKQVWRTGSSNYIPQYLFFLIGKEVKCKILILKTQENFLISVDKFRWQTLAGHPRSIIISDKTSYRMISWRLEAARFVFRIVWSLWNLTGTSEAVLSMGLSNFIAMRWLKLLISRLRDFMRSNDKTLIRHQILKRDTQRCKWTNQVGNGLLPEPINAWCGSRISTKFFIRHDSDTVVTCEKFHYDRLIIF